MLVKDIIAAIEEIAPRECQAEWDKSGLQVASEAKTANSIAVFLDPVPDILEKALATGAGFLLAHHPLSLRSGLPDKLDNWFYGLKIVLTAGVPLYSAHTSLDVNLTGPAGWLGAALNLQDVRPVETVSCPSCNFAGYGGIGKLPENRPLEAIIQQVLSLCSCKDARLCGKISLDSVKTVAWCGGSGASLIKKAQALGAEFFVTGDIKYHDALEAEIPVLDVGHHSIEEIMMKKFAEILQKRLPQINVIFISSRSPFSSVVNKE